MAGKLAISFDWQGGFDRERMFERIAIADERAYAKALEQLVA
jgi:hypothetical protein